MISHEERSGEASAALRSERDTLRDLVIGLSPFGQPDARLVAGVCQSGAVGVLDLGGPGSQALAELTRLAGWVQGQFGVRVSRSCDLVPGDLDSLASRLGTLVLGADLTDDPQTPWLAAECAARWRVLVEVTSVEAALAARADGAAGVIAVGWEAAGRVGSLSSFVLTQRLLAADLGLPVWVRGGLGTHTAAAAVVGGATGVVLDVQLSLLEGTDAAGRVAATECRLDGATTVVAGYRVQVPPAARTSADELEAMTPEDVLARIRRRPDQPAWAPLGQDGFIAARFAARFGTVARAVRGVQTAIAAALAEPGPGLVVSDQSPLCAALGLRRPVVQGPMTRVSDTAEFALAVAEDGALPCLALAMADRSASTRMLRATRELLGERPWGVGILGFGSEEVRAAQLEVIREFRPSMVVIAGGRPAQAADLEAAGIPAFLHVPSSTLLRQYLEAGTRRFIFEGTECGGHVGPLASFPLWEAQLGVITDFLDGAGAGDAGEVQVLFAGGIHDARSAAMVAAAGAPLAARGVGMGLLMGTAYLFTSEAVTTGAIQPLFQQQVIEAESTTVLQSAPGHLTRCVPSPFVERFEQTQRELREQGASGPEAWARLESLNVGRLRVAAKGLLRRDDELVTVEAEGQLAEGLFMAGQVATLRGAATTIPALHDSVTVEAVRFLAQARENTQAGTPPATTAPRTEPQPVDIAIVGMACVLPKSADLAEYWTNVVCGVDAIEPIPAHRWNPEVFYDSSLGRNPSGRYTPSKWGGFLPRIPFDPLRYGIPPSTLPNVDPVQFLALDVARRALDDARLAPGTFDRTRTAVVFGTETNSEYQTAITLRGELPAYYGEVPPELDELLPKIAADTFPGILGNIIASRISNRLDLAGPAYVVDAACGSSLAALDLACKELVFGTADTVLCGGADLHVASSDYLMFSSLGALSPDGRAKPFDAAADGTTLAEGVACVVLKRLADAERDGDRIYAVIKAVAGASDGRSLGITAPRVEGQYLALQRTYQRAGISPAEVGLVEAHGTGTVVGDQTELRSLTQMYSQAEAPVGHTQLGSVKSQIGHAKTAAGLAGLIKVALSIYHGVRPPTLHLKDPNPAWEPDTSPFAFATTARPWPVPRPARVGAVSAFGFGGANFHTVVTGHGDDTPHQHTLDTWPAELFLFRGTDRAASLAQIRSLRGLVAANDDAGRPWRLRDFARTASGWADQATAPVQVAFVATDLDELARLLDAAVTDAPGKDRRLHLATPTVGGPGKLAVLFPGQGSQRPGMLADLFVTFPELQEYLRYGEQWADLIHPPATFTPERAAAAKAAVTDTRVAQPALGIAGLAAHHLLDRLGVRPDMVGGHSYGELVALAVAGVYDPNTLLRLSSQRAKAILDAAEATGGDTGTMAAVRASTAQVHDVLAETGLAGEVVVANRNAPKQVVISGTTPGVAKAVAALTAAGYSATPIPVACAFHSPLISSAVDRFAASLAEAPIAAPTMPVYANRIAATYPADADAVRAELALQVGSPVRFVEQIEAMYAAGARMFVEAGPGRVLTGLVNAVLGDRPHTALAMEGTGTGLPGLLELLAGMAVAGVVPRTEWLYRGRDTVDLTGAVPPRRSAWSIDGRAVVTADGQPLPGGLRPTCRVQRSAPEPVMAASGHAPAETAGNVGNGGDDRRALVSEFLRTSRDMLVQQRDVLLSYLGTPAGQVPAPAIVPPSPVPAGRVIPPARPTDQPNGAAGRSSGAQPSTPQPSTPQPATAQGSADLAGTVVEVICASTGYPADMVEPDLDLETDLSVDSIKRTEIAGVLLQRLPAAAATGGVDDLTKLRTVRTITAWLEERVGQPAASQPAAGQHAAGASPATGPTADGLDQADLAGTVVEVICASTGYPADMVEPDLDLETDLSVDSIKRTEIAGVLLQRLPAAAATGGVDDLTKLRTVRTITAWLEERCGVRSAAPEPTPGGTAAIETALGTKAAGTATTPPAPAAKTGRAPERFVTEYQPEPLPAVPGRKARSGRRPTGPLAGRRVTICGECFPGEVAAIGGQLRTAGADVAVVPEGEFLPEQPDPDIVVMLGGWSAQEAELELPGAYQGIRSALLRGPRVLIGVVPLAAIPAPEAGKASDQTGCDRFVVERAAGLRGLWRTIAVEYPSLVTRMVEIDPQGAAVAEAVVAEVVAAGSATPGGPAVVSRHTAAGRTLARVVPARLGALASSGAGPAGEGSAEAAAIGLDRDAVVLLVGGARGITAGFTTLLAAASECRVELVGRSTPPKETEDPSTAGALDEQQLRRAVIASGVRSPREVQAAIRRILADREIRATLTEVTRRGGRARYHQADVLDAGALRKVIEQVVSEGGRLDGVVYAAGVIDDRLVADKDLASFQRVFATKVDGAQSLLSALEDLAVRPRFVTLFGSIAGVAGNRGQSDYAAGNDALETLGCGWAQRTGVRTVTVHWGPWAPSLAHPGMVNPGLESEFARRRIELIDQEEGHLALLRELAWGDRGTRAVVYTASGWFLDGREEEAR